jgi:molybdenum-dependent DNA-binding transcriptional regulator ModE
MDSQRFSNSHKTEKPNFSWKKYDSINTEKRKRLLQKVEGRMGVKQASEELGINYQTAKSIIRRYRLSGKIERINRILRQRGETEDDDD